ncbi:MAG: S53 family peptidase, partial [Solirubrobacteraceae bacterium]
TLYASSCLTPQNLQQAYFPGEAPDAPASEPQTIALVDAYNDLNAEADLKTYSSEFGLPECTRENGCFAKVGESGSETALPFPSEKSELEAYANGAKHRREKAEEAEGWALETDTDIEVAHAICQNCHILLVEASGPEYGELETAENAAVALHATEISNSWGGPENGADSSAFTHPGVVIAAASGDDGYLNWDQYPTRNQAGSAYFQGADYPASSPHVLSVGGTELQLNEDGGWASESPWNAAAKNEGAGGSGCSGALPAPSWQRDVADWAQVGCGSYRANADVSADADPSTGVNVYDSTPYPEEGKTVVPNWVPIGGTSVATPMVSAMFALAGGANGVAYPAATLYAHLGEASLHDVSGGGNGACDDDYTSCEGSLVSPLDCGEGAWICNATVGYDGPTGVGTPDGLAAFKPSAGSGGEGEPKTTTPEEPTPEGGSPTGGAKSGEGPVQPLSGGAAGTTSGGQSTTLAGAPAGGAKLSPTSAPRILSVALTPNARAAARVDALRSGELRIAQIAFSLRMTRAGTIKVVLAMRVGGRRQRWRKGSYSFGFAAAGGLNRRHLRGGAALAPGVYRLTFTPTGGSARSLVFRVL